MGFFHCRIQCLLSMHACVFMPEFRQRLVLKSEGSGGIDRNAGKVVSMDQAKLICFKLVRY